MELRKVPPLCVRFAAVVGILFAPILSNQSMALNDNNLATHPLLLLETGSSSAAHSTHAFCVSPSCQRSLQLLAVSTGLSGLAFGLLLLSLYIKERRQYREKLDRAAEDLVAAGKSERTRIARELHDGVCQWLAVSKNSFERASEHGFASDPGYLQHLSKGLGYLEEGIREIRRISHDLKPAMPDDQAFVDALASLVHDFAERTQVDLRVDGLDTSKAEKLDPHTQFALFRTAQEALTNIEKHAGASQIVLTLKEEEEMTGQLTLAILDNGCGFQRARASGNARRGIGVSNMRERVAEVGGAFTLRSTAEGTEVIAVVPTITTRPPPPIVRSILGYRKHDAGQISAR